MILSSRQEIYLIEECWSRMYKVLGSTLSTERWEGKERRGCLSWGVLFVDFSLKSLVQILLDRFLPPTPEIITSQNPIAVSSSHAHHEPVPNISNP